MMPHLMNCAHDPEGWCLDCVKELAESTLPAAAVRDALEKLRAGYTLRADGEGASIPWRAATDLARQELDAAMTALGLGAEGEKR